jgi:tripartite-type tricarboxylate transporter receptor subunit TctC
MNWVKQWGEVMRAINSFAFIWAALAGFLTTGLSDRALSQSLSDRPIRIVATAAAGGALDLVARAVAQGLTDMLGTTVVVENRAGASGALASVFVAKSAPDGHTLLLGSPMSHSINPALNPKVPYSVVNDFTPICLVAIIPQILVVPKSLGVDTFQSFVKLAKSRPDMSFGSAGIGSLHHLAGLKFASMVGFKARHIPYKGTGPALVDLLGGQFDYMLVETSAAAQYVKAGSVKALAIATRNRSPDIDVPTFGELGYPDFQSAAWYGVFGPAGMSAATVDQLNAKVIAGLAQPGLRRNLEALGATVVSSSPAEFGRFVQKDLEDWTRVVKENGLTIN